MSPSPREDDDESDDGEISSTTFEKTTAQRADLVGGGCTDLGKCERLRGGLISSEEKAAAQRDERIWGEIERKSSLPLAAASAAAASTAAVTSPLQSIKIARFCFPFLPIFATLMNRLEMDNAAMVKIQL
ncbi:uncharacterized protein A4U43_C06F14350 [Asparagus officinalis]|uniref:Uncharacterized protein n=1 Tax=Asparagus officinalis TaxID=4686 RepID=A0A5P1EMW0_ASPOF|nr:uncharacterized protein A4U43_C06F14350 [Asparagus officinalis]